MSSADQDSKERADEVLRSEHAALVAAFNQWDTASAEERERLLAQLDQAFPSAACRLREMLARAAHTALDDPIIDLRALGAGASMVAGPDGESPPRVASMSPPAPPGRIGPYRIQRLLGSGSSADVFEAESTAPPHRRVALKVLRTGLFDAERRWRLERECEALASLVHPNVATLFGAGIDDGRPWLAMELVRGRPLHEWARVHRPDPMAAAALMVAVCDGVHALHQRGAIHRDIKPANIMIAEADAAEAGSAPEPPVAAGSVDRREVAGRDAVRPTGQPVPKIIDLGLARLEARRNETMQTRSQAVLGTLGYLSPEALEGRGDLVDVRSDVYSLGVVLFELVAGRRPERRDATREDGPPSLRRAARGCPPELDAVAAMALAPRREERYVSVAALAEDLRRVMEHRPVLARRPSWVRVALLALRRRPVLGAAIAACIISLAGLAWLLADRAIEQGRRAVEDDRLISQLLDDVVFGLREVPGTDRFARAAAAAVEPVLARRIATDPDDVRLYLAAARIRSWHAGAARERGDLERAQQEWSAALRLLDEGLRQVASAPARERAALEAARLPDRLLAERSLVLVVLGECAREAGDIAGMDARFREALAIDEALAAAQPRSAAAIARLAYSYERLSLAAQNRMAIPESEALHHRQGEQIAAWEALEPGEPEPARARCRWHLRDAWYHEQAGDVEAQIRAHEAALALARALVLQDDESALANRVNLELLAVATRDFALLLGAIGRVDEATALAAEPMGRLRTLVASDAERSAAAALLASQQWVQARVLFDSGRCEEAIAPLREAIATLDAALQVAPDRTQHLFDRSAYANRLVQCLASLGRREEALAASRVVVESLRAATERRPTSEAWTRLAWVCLEPVITEERDVPAGLAAAHRAVERDPASWRAAHCLAVALAQAGLAEEAAAEAKRALAILPPGLDDVRVALEAIAGNRPEGEAQTQPHTQPQTQAQTQAQAQSQCEPALRL